MKKFFQDLMLVLELFVKIPDCRKMSREQVYERLKSIDRELTNAYEQRDMYRMLANQEGISDEEYYRFKREANGCDELVRGWYRVKDRFMAIAYLAGHGSEAQKFKWGNPS